MERRLFERIVFDDKRDRFMSLRVASLSLLIELMIN